MKSAVEKLLAQAVGVPLSRRSGSRLAMTLLATKNISSITTFSNRRSAWIQKLI